MNDAMTYGRYLGLDALLSAQNPLSEAHDETLFIIIHQTKELWLKQILHELSAARGWISAGNLPPALKAMARVCRIQAVMTQSWDVLSTLTPPDYLTCRHVLGTGSGFQSHQFRALEFLLGLRDAAYLRAHPEGGAARAALEAALAEPSLYDAALAHLAQRGLSIPTAVLERKLDAPWEADATVEAAWLEVYRNPKTYWDLYELAEELVDLEENFRQWRFRHITLVERVIGRKRGTGGTSGVDYLHRGLDKRCFPELWSVRTAL